MFIARLQCSDPACAEESVAEAATLAELETLSCERCGCGLAVLAWPDFVEDEERAEVIPLRARRPTDGLPSAA